MVAQNMCLGLCLSVSSPCIFKGMFYVVHCTAELAMVNAVLLLASGEPLCVLNLVDECNLNLNFD